jgi:hypothetical protein
MAESVADDPKLAALWDVGQNPWRCAKGHTFLRSPTRSVEAEKIDSAIALCDTFRES